MQQKKFSTMLTLKIINVFLADTEVRQRKEEQQEKSKQKVAEDKEKQKHERNKPPSTDVKMPRVSNNKVKKVNNEEDGDMNKTQREHGKVDRERMDGLVGVSIRHHGTEREKERNRVTKDAEEQGRSRQDVSTSNSRYQEQTAHHPQKTTKSPQQTSDGVLEYSRSRSKPVPPQRSASNVDAQMRKQDGGKVEEDKQEGRRREEAMEGTRRAVEPMVVSAHKLQIETKKQQGGDRTPSVAARHAGGEDSIGRGGRAWRGATHSSHY